MGVRKAQPPTQVQVNIDRRPAAEERMAPLLKGCTLDEKREMLRLIELGEQRVAAATATPAPVVIQALPATRNPSLDPEPSPAT